MGPMPLPPWLSSLPSEEGFFHISQPRRFAHDEAQYDAQYDNDPGNRSVGRGLVQLLKDSSADVSSPALEVGCGTGLVSLGLAEHSPYPLTIFTDPSPAFLRITQGKIRKHSLPEDRLAYAVMMGEEIDRVRERALSLVVLRSTLHHVLHVDRFIADAARTLVPGGILTFQEPCMEGYILMGAMVQFLPRVAEAAGQKLSPEQLRSVALFADTMKYYARRDVDKTKAEDKHLFRVDELMKIGDSCGLSTEFHANTAYESYQEPGSRPAPDAFLPFFRNYAKYCMSWDETLMRLFDQHLLPYCALVEEASAGGSGPYLHGVFVCRKR
jgi:ubiquinone/menaquinone biosynthesis C-methylase UbiE